MKNTITILAAFFFLMNASFATVRTVSNDPAGGAQYPDISSAYLAAVSGMDTLLMEGTNIVYENGLAFNWDKNLVVIGSGFNPNKQNQKRTKIGIVSTCCSSLNMDWPGNGSKFYGIEFTLGLRLGSTAISDYTFEDCIIPQLDGSGPGVAASNLTFRNCVFTNAGNNGAYNVLLWNVGTFSNFLFTNCIFNRVITGFGNTTLGMAIDHCLFLSSNASIDATNNVSISNSIFMNNSTIQNNGSTGNFYTNCLSSTGSFPSGTGNAAYTLPLFVSYNGANYSSADNYNLQAANPAFTGATDGSQIGVHGGNSNFSETGEVLIAPVIQSLIINNTNVQPNGPMNIQIHARKPTDN